MRRPLKAPWVLVAGALALATLGVMTVRARPRTATPPAIRSLYTPPAVPVPPSRTSASGSAAVRQLNIAQTLPTVQLPAPRPVLGPISFINTADGWAADGPQIQGTTDGGTRWIPLGALPAAVTSLDFVSPTTGWAAAGGKLYASDNGGRAWRLLPVAATTVAFATPTDGWVLSAASVNVRTENALARTVDGGTRWTPVPLPCYAISITAPAPDTAFLLCAGMESVGMQQKSIYTTTDGGQSWTLVDAAPMGGSSVRGLSGAGYARSIAFSTPSDGWLLFGGACSCVFDTTNGGREWSGVATPFTNAERATGIAFPAPGQMLVSAGNYFADTLWATLDGGGTWTARWPTLNPATIFVGANGTDWAQAQGVPLMRSTNGGRTWSAVDGAPGTVQEVSAPSGAGLYLLAGTGKTLQLLFAPNTAVQPAGWTGQWQTRALPGGTVWMGFVTAQTGFAVAGKALLRTEDGGRSWTQTGQLPPTAVYMDNVAFSSANTVWVAGDMSLQTTQNAGQTWQAYAVPTGLSVEAVAFRGPEGVVALVPTACVNGVSACQASTTLLRTSNGGASWSEQTLAGHMAAPAGSVAVLGPEGIALETGEGWLVTTDNGATWSWSGGSGVRSAPPTSSVQGSAAQGGGSG